VLKKPEIAAFNGVFTVLILCISSQKQRFLALLQQLATALCYRLLQGFMNVAK
jgi:hypothetical protein